MNLYTTNKFFKKGLCLVLLVALILVGCKKLAETPIPSDVIAENAVYSNDATSIAVLTAIYTTLNEGPFQGSQSNTGSITLNSGLAVDEFAITTPFVSNNSLFLRFYQNDLSQTNPSSVSGGEHWSFFYNAVFKCNAAIAGLSSPQADALTPKVQQQLLGEAKFLRAFFYFYMVNEFGDVPLVLTTDPQTNTNLPRAKKADVYQQMIADLLDAEEKLSADYLDISLLSKTTERVRPTKWAATALLARVYLYNEEYMKAEQKATAVINNSNFNLLPDLNKVFLKNSSEAIWQIQPTEQNINTREGLALNIPATGPSSSGSIINPACLSKQLLNSFEATDKRRLYGNWVDTTIYKLTAILNDTMAFAYKYKIGATTGVTTVGALTEYFMMLRLGEQYLIRSEARSQLNNIGGAQSDLNLIRNRAGLPNTIAGDKTSLLAAIIHERQVELFAEIGHRLFDLKRTGNIDAVMNLVTPLKTNGSAWRSYQQLFPIPLSVIQSSPNVKQNPGY
ncbi:MAG: RagB/SusD family nutrient uptake outer membrane protein [Sediminibacterium sp.]